MLGSTGVFSGAGPSVADTWGTCVVASVTGIITSIGGARGAAALAMLCAIDDWVTSGDVVPSTKVLAAVILIGAAARGTSCAVIALMDVHAIITEIASNRNRAAPIPAQIVDFLKALPKSTRNIKMLQRHRSINIKAENLAQRPKTCIDRADPVPPKR